jgi:hypothetical protein
MPKQEFAGATPGVDPKSYSAGRPYGPCIWIVIHATDGADGARSAEDGNAYDAKRTDGTSTHVFVDRNSVVQEVNSANRAHAARTVANNRGYHVELCGTAAQTAAQWHDVGSSAELLLAAQHCARVCVKLGIPSRWLTKADVDARRPGFLTHADVTTFLEGTHTDPGKNFPRNEFITLVAYWIGKYSPPPPPAASEEDPPMQTVKPAGTNAIYKTDGWRFEHITSPVELANLQAAFGPTRDVKSMEGLGAGTLYTEPTSKKAVPENDSFADNPAVRGEHG